jgi:hypothetical protein
MTTRQRSPHLKERTRQYTISCLITRRTYVIVEATSSEHAMMEFHAMHWVDEDSFGEITDFTHSGQPKLNE